MNKWFLVASGCALATATFLLTACRPEAGGGGSGKSENKSIEVVAFKGGFGIDFYESSAKLFTDETGKKVSVSGDPRVWEKLKPRFIEGNVPDLMFPGWGFDHWTAASEGQLEPLDSYLDQPDPSGKPWRENFDSAALKLGQIEGKQMVLPYYVPVMGWWYDEALFKKNGWIPPKTSDDLLALGEKMIAAGVSPLTYQGQYPDYMIVGFLLPWIHSAGGPEDLNSCFSLEPGAWSSPSVVRSVEFIALLRDRGFFQKEALALNHTESQMQFIQGKAAMIPCGTWLVSEMQKSIPEGANYRFFLPPVFPDGAGDPSAVAIKIEPWMVPARAKNKEGAIEFFRFMTQPEQAKKFVREKGTLTAVVGSEPDDMPSFLKEASQAVRGSNQVWANRIKDLYHEFYKFLEQNMTELLAGRRTPQEFVRLAEAEAEKVRKDPEIRKYKL
ncbi:MAG: extracellular solute-binding protein [Fimbriimonadaceae bacterium]|jgi:N-acetylglucosamine transport system substrate-binding protein|nr:extracellular solute-binding protein [Fimbriimonadaceae bacterium]